MNSLNELIGQGNDLSVLQMSIRALLIFITALVLLRFSGRRSFGMRSPFDNVISILLGAILSRAVVGVSPFFSTLVASFVIVAMHRFFGWLSLYNDQFGKLIKGEPQIIYKDKQVIKNNMKKCLISDKDLMEGVRLEGNVDSLEEIKIAYVERDGQISIIK